MRPSSDPATDMEAEFRTQFTTVFEAAEYPLASPFELIPLLPDGPTTKFSANGVTVPAIDLGLRHGHHLSFPYSSVEKLVDDIIRALKADGVLPL